MKYMGIYLEDLPPSPRSLLPLPSPSPPVLFSPLSPPASRIPVRSLSPSDKNNQRCLLCGGNLEVSLMVDPNNNNCCSLKKNKKTCVCFVGCVMHVRSTCSFEIMCWEGFQCGDINLETSWSICTEWWSQTSVL